MLIHLEQNHFLLDLNSFFTTLAYDHSTNNMIFENATVDLSQLPTISGVEYKKLDRAHLRVSYIGTVLFFGILAGAYSLVFIFSDLRHEVPIVSYVIAAIILFWFLLSMFLVAKQYKVEGYALRERDILHKKGIIFHKHVSIPFNRVQHCEVKQGPIERIFGLKTIEIFTAGGQSSDLSISGLKDTDAQLMKEFIINKTVEDELI